MKHRREYRKFTSPLFSNQRQRRAIPHGQESSLSLGVVGLIVGVSLMLLSLFLDYMNVNHFWGITIGVGIISFALFPEIAYAIVLPFLILKGADRKLVISTFVVSAGLLMYGWGLYGF